MSKRRAVASSGLAARSHVSRLQPLQRLTLMHNPAISQISQILYRSGPEWESRFDRRRVAESGPHTFYPDYNIEAYLDHMVR
jgi:homoserine acetyltransferase